MTLKPKDIEDLQADLKKARSSIEHIDLSSISACMNHAPEDMTARVQAGMKLKTFQKAVNERGQWLPVDPPNQEEVSIGDIINYNLNGPRRFGFGTIRDWLIGIRFILPDGRCIFNGGNVVKNVAGFDLCKLMVGSRGTLGIVVEAIFKLSPLPQKEMVWVCTIQDLTQANELLVNIRKTILTPSILDLLQETDGSLKLIVGFSGTTSDVNAQTEQLFQMAKFNEGDLQYDNQVRAIANNTHSILPAKITDLIKQTPKTPWVSRAGNGILYSTKQPAQHTSSPIEKRIKQLFDPNGILPAL